MAATFHARFDAKSKVYQYRILNRDTPAAVGRNYCWFIRKQLDLSASLPPIKRHGKKGNGGAPIIDLTAYGCPLHYIKARNELRKFKDGDEVDFLFVSGDPSQQVSTSLKSDGHEILSVQEQGTATRIKVRKVAEAGAVN